MNIKCFATFTVCMLVLGGCNYNVFNPTKPPNFVKVYPTGSEEQIIKRFSTEDRMQYQDDQAHPNCLDEALAVLTRRAYPTPNPKAMVRSALEAMCAEYGRQTGRQVPSAHREAWIWNAYRQRSFEQALAQLQSAKPRISDAQALIEEGLKGMLRVAGPHSAQLYDAATAEAFKKIQTQSKAPEPGILGIAVDNWPRVEVLPLSPAAEAGLKNGDVILTLDGQNVQRGMTVSQRDRLLEGPAGSELALTFRREATVYRCKIRRGTRAEMSVRASIPSPGICYLRIPTFEGTGVGQRVSALVRRAQAAGVKAFLLDLRGNAGGNLNQANAIADLFVDDRPLQTFAFRIGRRVIFKAREGRIPADVYVLTNRSTASAAEILAMALRDNQAARIVGEDTFGALFGKDFHQLSTGHMIFFRAELTILSPQGEDYSLTGVPPDIAVEDRVGQGRDAIYQTALSQAKQGLAVPGRQQAAVTGP
jgi:carboxyl-terminal processing protease